MDLKLTCNEQTYDENTVTHNNNTDHLDQVSNKQISDVRKNGKHSRRRNHSIRRREPTPIRSIQDVTDDEIMSTESYDDERNTNHVSEKVVNNSQEHSNTASCQNNGKRHQENDTLIHHKTESISELAQQEIKSLFNKTKKRIASAAVQGRERFRKYEQQLVKRSQSAPKKFMEELQEGLKKVEPLRSEYLPKRKYSDSNLKIIEPSRDLRPSLLKSYAKSPSIITPKVIEILDPKTTAVLARRTTSFLRKNKEISRVAPLPTASLFDIYINYKIHKSQYKSDYDRIKKLTKKCICEIFLIMVFCGLGGLLFKFTEGTFETYYKCGVKRVKRDFLDLLWTKSHNLREDDWKSLARNRLRLFEEELHSAHEAGMTDYSGQRSWSFLNGIVYSLTIITTIGYGHMYPKTHTGRALSIVYALIGIPLFLIALTDFGKLFTRCIKFFWSFVRRVYYTGSCRKVRKTAAAGDIFKGAQMVYDIATFRRPSSLPTPQSTDSEGQPQTIETPTTPAISNFEIDDEFNLPISVALFILVAYIICGAVMYMVIERWDFFEAFYFVFISMSTIGFGDYVPRDPVFMIGSIIYLVFGLALMSMCINVVQAKLSDTFKQASAKIGATMGLEVDEDGSIVTATPENIEIVPTFVPNTSDTK